MTVKTDRSGTAVAQSSDRPKHEGPRVSTEASDPIAPGVPGPTG